jgi:hypothetical protein
MITAPETRREETFRLLKLHGSLDWWWVPNDQSGSSLVRQTPPRRFEDPPQSLVPRFVPGRERFVVPSRATKSQ